LKRKENLRSILDSIQSANRNNMAPPANKRSGRRTGIPLTAQNLVPWRVRKKILENLPPRDVATARPVDEDNPMMLLWTAELVK